MRITRLGQGVDAAQPSLPTPSSAPSRSCASTARSSTASASKRVRMTATSAARDAANRDDFFAAAEAVVGVRPELLDGRRRGAPVLRRGDRRAGPGRRAVPGGRHRRGLDRVRPRTGPRRPLEPPAWFHRRGLRALHREVPARRPAPTRGAVPGPVGVPTTSTTCAGSCPASTTPPASSAWPAPSPPRPRSRSAWPPTTPTASTTSC